METAIKVYEDPSKPRHSSYTWVLLGEQSEEYDEETEEVTWSINVAPVDEEGEIENPIEYFNTEIRALTNARDLIQVLMAGGNPVKVETDFYYSDGDLLVRITVPITHPIFKPQ